MGQALQGAGVRHARRDRALVIGSGSGGLGVSSSTSQLAQL